MLQFRFFTLSIFAVLLAINASSQGISSLRGIIQDSETRDPLAFATVSLKNGNRGVVTNFFGEFEMQLQPGDEKDSLWISILGYEPQSHAIQTEWKNRTTKFYLDEQVIVLEEIKVETDPMTAKEIVEKVIENIPNNYPTDPYLQHGFTRAYKSHNGKAVWLFEGLFDVHGKGYNTKSKLNSSEKVYLKASRQTKKVDRYMSRTLEANRNPFVAFSHLNDVALVSRSLNVNRLEYKIDRYTFLDGRLVAIIYGTHATTDPEHMMFTLYVDVEDFSLVKTFMEFNTKEDEYWNPILLWGKETDTTQMKVTYLGKTLQFEKNDGKYLPKYINWTMGGVLEYSADSTQIGDWEGRFEMMFTDSELADFEAPDKKNLLKAKNKKDPPRMAYDEEMWSANDPLFSFPINEDILENLGGRKEVMRQFKAGL